MWAKNFAGEACAAHWGGPTNNERLVALMKPEYHIVVELGNVKKKNDGRWLWRIKAHAHNIFTHATTVVKFEGVCPTIDEAKSMVMTAWGVGPVPPNLTQEKS